MDWTKHFPADKGPSKKLANGILFATAPITVPLVIVGFIAGLLWNAVFIGWLWAEVYFSRAGT